MEAQAAQAKDEVAVESSDTPAKPEDYAVIDGYRLVKPYHFDFCCSVRQRWFGQNIIEIFSREFPARDRSYYLQAFADGRLRVEGCQVAADTPLRDGQRMRHFIHRHEPPVPAGPIPVVGQSSRVVAVCKPAGMPVHVAGQYRKNTVLGVLQAERPDLGALFPVHRLDKPVSGLLLFARSAEAAADLCRQIEGRGVEKVYVARVLGRFPACEDGRLVVADVPLGWDPVANHAFAAPEAAAALVQHPETLAAAAGGAAAAAAAEGDGAGKGREQQGQASEADQQADGEQQQGEEAQQPEQQEAAADPPPRTEERRQRRQQQKKAKKAAKAERQAAAAAAAAAASGKPSKGAPKPALTEFRLLSVAEDGRTSLVECRPRTGRTHQIRVHLQWLGHPIANDAQYGGTFGGPLPSRHMARHLGVHWSAEGGGREDGNGEDGGDGGSEHGTLPAGDQQAGEDAAEADGGAKRPRLAAAAGPAGAAEARSSAGDGAGDAGGANDAAAASAAGAGAAAGESAAYEQNAAFRSRPEFEVAAELRDPLCIHCPYYAPRDYPLDLRPLWLHARSYSCLNGEWSFSAELPGWARPDWRLP